MVSDEDPALFAALPGTFLRERHVRLHDQPLQAPDGARPAERRDASHELPVDPAGGVGAQPGRRAALDDLQRLPGTDAARVEVRPQSGVPVAQVEGLADPQGGRGGADPQQAAQFEGEELPDARGAVRAALDEPFGGRIGPGGIHRPLVAGLGDQRQFAHLGVEQDLAVVSQRVEDIVVPVDQHLSAHTFDYSRPNAR